MKKYMMKKTEKKYYPITKHYIVKEYGLTVEGKFELISARRERG